LLEERIAFLAAQAAELQDVLETQREYIERLRRMREH